MPESGKKEKTEKFNFNFTTPQIFSLLNLCLMFQEAQMGHHESRSFPINKTLGESFTHTNAKVMTLFHGYFASNVL